jgi:phosphopantetheinyl transferase
MPLLNQWSPTPESTAAVWRIEEDEDFFLNALSAGPHLLAALGPLKVQKRRLEFLAGRYLLRYLAPGFPLRLIKPDEHDKPRLPEDALRFSISHSFPFAAAVVSSLQECGIDVQKPHPRIAAFADKFLTPAEREHTSEREEDLLLAWSVKEAAYKWQGRRGVEFREHLPLTGLERGDCLWRASIELRLTDTPRPLEVHGWQEEEYALAVAIS